MKTLLILIMLLFAAPVFAQTGVFMDEERRGEGVTVFQHVDLHGDAQATFYFYTYDHNDNQRWFLGSDEWTEGGSTGLLYEAHGVNYPIGLPSSEPFEEDVMIVGKPFEVGTYVLRSVKDGGYLLWVSRLEVETLDRDYLYDRTFFFTYPLIQIK